VGSLGGPLVQALGLTLPAPMLMAGGRYGLRDDLSIGAEVNVTAAVYGGLHLAPQVAWQAVAPGAGAAPGWALAGTVHLLASTTEGEVLVAPQATALAVWRLGARHLAYGGADAVVAVPASPVRLLAGPLAGVSFALGERAGLALEAKWLAPYVDTEPAAPSWVSPGHRGYLSVMVGWSYAFGGGAP
jgi:hypothetical protein